MADKLQAMDGQIKHSQSEPTTKVTIRDIIPVKSTDFGGSLLIFLPFLPSYRQPTDLPQSTGFYRFFRRSTDLFVISCKLCSHKCYFHVLMVKSA